MKMGTRRIPALVIFAVATTACGGKLLTSSEPGADASSAARGNGNGSQGDDTTSSGGGNGSGGSGGSVGGSGSGGGSSSGGGAFGGSSSSGAQGGSSSSGGTPGGVTCTSAAGCRTGTVCCGTIQMTTTCQVGPCPSSPIGPLQLCASTAECVVRGDTCGPIAAAPTLPVKICNAPTAAQNCTTTCTGCCDASGTCTMGTADTACGSVPGSLCTDCTASGAVCSNRVCTAALTH